MKIGLLTHSVNPRGGVIHTLELAQALHEAGQDVTVLAPALNDQSFFREVPFQTSFVKVSHTPTNTLDLVYDRVAAFEHHLTEVLPASNFDILHAHDGMGGNALANLKEKNLISGFVRTVHHLDPFQDQALQMLQMRSVTQADQVLCVSQLWVTHLLKEHGIHAYEVCNGVDAKRFSQIPQSQDKVWAQKLGIEYGCRPILLSVGGVESRKNTVKLLEAFALWRMQPGFENSQWVIAGGASLLDHSQTMLSFIQTMRHAGLKSGAKNDVLITGPLPEDAMPSLYRLADIVAMPSLREGFGLVVLEALCSGKPVVVSNIAPFTEYLWPQDVAFVDPMSHLDIARALGHAWMHRGSPRIHKAARRLADQFSWSRSADQHISIYQSLLKPNDITNPLQESLLCQ